MMDNVRHVLSTVMSAPHIITVPNAAMDFIFTNQNQKNVWSNVLEVIMVKRACARCANLLAMNVHLLTNVSPVSKTIV